ncbi:MAG: biotin/lipoyl-containing protein [Thermoanaerobaculaceae bacterium]
MRNKFKLVLEGVPYEIERRGELIVVNGCEMPAAVVGAQFHVGGNPHAVEISGATAKVDGVAYPFQAEGLEEPKAKPTRKAASAAAAEEAGAITAIMPGLIIKVLKHEGDRVQPGDVVVVLEAMKMQNELHAKQGGVVKQVLVKEGDTVEMRQVLAVIE